MARDFATHGTQIERGWSASETTLRVDDISIFDISDVFGGIGSRCLAIYPIRLSLGNCFFALRTKFEDTTDGIAERVLRDNTASHLVCGVVKLRFARRHMGDMRGCFWIGNGFRN